MPFSLTDYCHERTVTQAVVRDGTTSMLPSLPPYHPTKQYDSAMTTKSITFEAPSLVPTLTAAEMTRIVFNRSAGFAGRPGTNTTVSGVLQAESESPVMRYEMSKAKFVVGSQRLRVFAERRARGVSRVVGENQRANLRTFRRLLFALHS
jgi:hypothetical protein